MSVTRHPLATAALVLPLLGIPVAGAEAAQEAAPPGPERIEITGTAGADDGRDSTAARVVLTRDELARHGDSSVIDALRRVPGITIAGGQGRASDVRMRGLGNGYTQILVNGEPMPAGFSLETLSPGQIERIEISRVATVDVGAQAIAGTINIILRQSVRKAQRELKATASSRSGRGAAQLEGQFSDRLERLSYSLGVGLGRRSEAWPSDIAQQETDPAGVPTLQRLTRRRAYGMADSISLTPSLTPQWGERDKVNLEALWRHNRFDDHSDDQRETLLGPLPNYSSDAQKLDLKTTLAQWRANWTHTLDGGGNVDSRLGMNHLRRASDTHFLGRDDQQNLAMDERVTSATTETGLTAASKLRLPYTESHAVAIGWDGEQTRREESRSQRQTSPIGRPVVDLDERYLTTVQRLAVYLQDEWDIEDALSAYAGVRWAMLRTRTDGQGNPTVGNRSSVLSPVLQFLWKPADMPGDQVRFALSRTYKAPRAVDLIPRRFVAIDNTPTTPILQGNPDLRPELAWGVDLAYEHALPGKLGSINVNGTARRIQDVILERVALDNGAWVSTKANAGSARVYGLELESRLNLRAVGPAWPDVEARASVSRNWSAVDTVPGPDNRLDAQIPLSANLGFDWRLSGLPVTVGASLAYRGSMRAQTSLTQTAASNPMTTLDLYALWKLSTQVQWRLAVSNALSPHDVSMDSYGDGSGRFLQTTDAPTAPTFRLGIEIKL